MKLSLAFTVLILAAASFFGWQGHGKLSTARQENTRLVAEAQALGLDTKIAGKELAKDGQTKVRRDGRADKEADAKAFAKELIAFAREMEAVQKQGKEPDDKMQERIVGILGKMLDLDAGQLKVLVGEFRTASDLTDEMRTGMIGFAIMTLSGDHPQAALSLFVESSDMLKERGMSQHFVTGALTNLAKENPTAALEWVRKNAKDHPDMVNDQTKVGILRGAALQDPRLAFSLISELGLTDARGIGRSIAEAATTPEQQTAVLGALRDHLKGLEGEAREQMLKTTMSALAGKAIEGGHAAGIAWLESAGLDQAERSAITDGLNYYQTKSDTGKWLDWMGEKLPAERMNTKVGELVSQWTREDYKAAGQWIGDTKAGPVKDAAVRSYASTVAPYDPETAAQWALTLPANGERTQVLTGIYQQWKGKDAAAAAKFARDNGLQE